MKHRHVIVVDLGFGDAGKGTIVDWLCRNGDRSAVIRFNGGAQAAHNVVTDDGRHHTFAQFGAGSFVPGVRTHLAHTVLVDPFALIAEADHLASVGVGDALSRLTIDERALVTTPWHRRANQARERARGADRHGSCGMGVGETARYALAYPADAPTVGDCRRPDVLRRKLTLLARRLDPRRITAAPSGAADEAPVRSGTGVTDGSPAVSRNHVVAASSSSDVYQSGDGPVVESVTGPHVSALASPDPSGTNGPKIDVRVGSPAVPQDEIFAVPGAPYADGTGIEQAPVPPPADSATGDEREPVSTPDAAVPFGTDAPSEALPDPARRHGPASHVRSLSGMRSHADSTTGHEAVVTSAPDAIAPLGPVTVGVPGPMVGSGSEAPHRIGSTPHRRADDAHSPPGLRSHADSMSGRGAPDRDRTADEPDPRIGSTAGPDATLGVDTALGPPIDVDDVLAVLAMFAEAVRVVDAEHVATLLDAGPVVFEGAQGVLLDEWAGFHPYTTWSTTTTANATSILAEHGHTAYRLGVVRTYTTRHGAGPLPTEDEALAATLVEPHNGTGPWQGRFRVGHFDAAAHRYALAATGGVDGLAVTHLDVLDHARPAICEEYRLPNGASWAPEPPGGHDLWRQAALTRTLSTVTPVLRKAALGQRDWLTDVSTLLEAPIAVTSEGPTASAKHVPHPSVHPG